jgi:hypothetical protein
MMPLISIQQLALIVAYPPATTYTVTPAGTSNDATS